MQILKGKSVVKQIVVGQLCFYHRPIHHFHLYTQGTYRQEINRFYQAQQTAVQDLTALYQRAVNRVGEELASIFLIHAMLLEDRDYLETIRDSICVQGTTAEGAIQLAETSFSNAFLAMSSSYMRARATDIRDISQRMLRGLLGRRQSLLMDKPVSWCLANISPAR